MFRVARFYGWSLDEIREMDIEDLNLADLAIRELDAQERILDANVAVYPHMQRDDAERFMRGLHKLSDPQDEEQEVVKAVTPEQLTGMGYG